MIRRISFVWGAIVLAAAAAAAQTPVPADPMQSRYRISVMEGVLEKAVRHGVQQLRRQVQSAVPDLMLMSGAARARGYKLDDYGVFFDVEVPALHQSVAWSVGVLLDQERLAMSAVLNDLRAKVQTVQDARARLDLDQAIKRLEGQLMPPRGGAPVQTAALTAGPPRGQVSATTVDEPPPVNTAPPAKTPQAEASGARPPFLDDPVSAYETEVKSALIDAMLDHGGTLNIGDAEWLTIAARDDEDPRLSPGSPYEVATIFLRVRGSDLAAFRAGRLTREEAKKRVEIKEF